MQARLALGHHLHPRLAVRRVGDEPRAHRRPADLTLLRFLPPVRVTQHEVDAPLERAPQRDAVRVRLLDEVTCAVEQVAQEVREEVSGGLAGRERGERVVRDVCGGERARAQVQLEPTRCSATA